MSKNIANQIKNRLSLRDPLRDSLDIVVELSGALTLDKAPDLAAELQTVRKNYPTCSDFERDFVSLTFSIATGVGKTRLMGACIAYLHLARGIRNFFILAPNLTIYNKLMEDFGNPGYEKYVFRGIAEFVHHPPVIITGDNYAQGNIFKDQEVRINIFNISKFNRDSKPSRKKADKGKPPRIKRLSEYLGQSYWDYLCTRQDLVILMDEAHRYRADASRAALDELQPVLGLEMTATPFDEKGKPFKSVVYEYSLAHALADGKYIKIPAIAKRKNFVRDRTMTDEFIDHIMLEDAVSAHRDAREALQVYSRDHGVPEVKPFILVVCKNIEHAKEIETYTQSNDFFDGYFADKVLRIDSDTKNSEEVEAQFIALDSPENAVEIVIHVAMLSEGWDVTNLYTIVPLRASNSLKLVEQTIGRGLRLPYGGKRTGETKVDTLTVMAHDSFEKIIEAAQDQSSIWKRMSYVEIEERERTAPNTVVTVKSAAEAKMERERERIAAIENQEERTRAEVTLSSEAITRTAINKLNRTGRLRSTEDLKKPEVKARVLEQVRKEISKDPQQNLFAEQIAEEAAAKYEQTVAAWRAQIIEIPRMTNQLHEAQCRFEDFALDTSGFAFAELDEELLRVDLVDFKSDTIAVRRGIAYKPAREVVLTELLDFPEPDYDRDGELLRALTDEAVSTLEGSMENPGNLDKTAWKYRRILAQRIYEQMMPHFRIESAGYRAPEVRPFTEIRAWNFTNFTNFGVRDFREIITPKSQVQKYLFNGFKKSGHELYRFDSSTEQDFANVLEQDDAVLKWLRPAPPQFMMWYDNNRRRYTPDFIVETADTIYMAEPKAAGNMQDDDVQMKAEVGREYCRRATEFTSEFGGKPWRYLLLPHDAITRTSGFGYLANVYKSRVV